MLVMADISFATEQSPEAVAAQVRQEQEEAQRKATDEYLATPTADCCAAMKVRQQRQSR